MQDPLGFRAALLRARGLDRRQFLTRAGALSALPLLSALPGLDTPKPRFRAHPFTLGVASGDPDHRGFVLWTKLALDPLIPGGGLPPEGIPVDWEVASDPAMKTVVARGRTVTTPALGHSVHVEVETLQPNRPYWYRFRAGDELSPVGRSKTLPAPGEDVAQLRFAMASCQNYEQGLFTAYDHMAAEDLDLVFFLGDYIYEYKAGRNGKVRTHLGDEIESLDDYRVRYGQYKSDPLLQAAHAAAPWFVTWDDHEFDNNYADLVSEEQNIDPLRFIDRRASAYQAYYEMMPLRRRSLPTGPHLQLYRSAQYGKLATIQILDTRQYRSDQPNNDRWSPLNEAALNPRNTLLGEDQWQWLQRELRRSEGHWNILAQQVMMALVHRKNRDGLASYSMDQWPGYAAERARLLSFLAQEKVSNPVVLTGDIHSNWANELRIEDTLPDTPTVATEFVATSLSSGGNGTFKPKGLETLLQENPGVKFHSRERGYVRCTVTKKEWRSDYLAVDEVEKPGGKTTVRKSLRVPSGESRIYGA